jgi:hypothetical protein
VGRKNRKPDRMDRRNRRKAKLLDHHAFLLEGFDPLWEGERWTPPILLPLFIPSFLLAFLAPDPVLTGY